MLSNDEFEILRKIESSTSLSQRKLASDLGFSLGKLNYCLKALKDKGMIKLKNFKENTNKFGYVYILTPIGIAHKMQLTINYMKLKIREYDQLKKEYQKLKKINNINKNV